MARASGTFENEDDDEGGEDENLDGHEQIADHYVRSLNRLERTYLFTRPILHQLAPLLRQLALFTTQKVPCHLLTKIHFL